MNKRLNYFLFGLGAVLILFVLGIFVFNLQGIFLAPASMSVVDTFYTSESAVYDGASAGQTVYALNGASGFAFDFNGDGVEDLLSFNGDRALLIDGASDTTLYYSDGVGGSGRENALVVKVGDGRYVLVKSARRSCGSASCPYADSKDIAFISLSAWSTPTVSYSIGSLISQFPFAPPGTLSATSPSLDKITTFDVDLGFGESTIIAGTDSLGMQLNSYSLGVNSDGSIFVQPYSSPSCFPGTTILGTTTCERGPNLYAVTLERTNSNSDGVGIYDNILFSQQIIRMDSNGAMTPLASLSSFNGQNVPVVGGGTYTLYSTSLSGNQYHAFAVVDREALGSGQFLPKHNYWLYVLYSGRVIAFKFSIDELGAVILIPQWATPVFGLSEMSIGKLKGFSESVIFSGNSAINLDGVVVAQLSSGSISNIGLWMADSFSGYLFDKLNGYEIQPSGSAIAMLAKVLPPSVASFNFYTPPALGPAMIGGNSYSGVTQATDLLFDVDSNGNVFNRLLKFKDQQNALVFGISGETSVGTIQNEEQFGSWFKFIQRAHTSGVTYDSWLLDRELQVLGAVSNSCSGSVLEICYTGSPATQGVGACSTGTSSCSGGVWGTCEGEVLPSAEICDGLDNDCNGQVDEGFGTQTCGVGACMNTVSLCSPGQSSSCVPLSPSVEQCIDGIDNDCNGLTDCLDLLSCSTNSICITQFCGDGILQVGEQCDDGNLILNDGCTYCVIDNGYTCNSAVPNICSQISVCGNGIIESGETCDQGNNNVLNGDGCSYICEVEGGYSCSGSPSVCSSLSFCGDNICSGIESCSSCSIDCGTCGGGGSGGGGGGSGGGGGGSSGGSRRTPVIPVTPSANQLGGTSDSEPDDSEAINIGGNTEDNVSFIAKSRVNFVLWVSSIVILAVIFIIGFLIFKSLRQKQRFAELNKIAERV